MSRKLVMSAVAAFVLIGNAYAQEVGAGAGRVEIGAFPGGAMFFTQSNTGNEPDFGNYAFGASFTVNVNRWIGIEGEGGGSVGLRQDVKVGPELFADHRTPGMWAYSGNIVVNPGGSDLAVVPFVTGGLGGLTLCPCHEAERLGVTTYETYFTGDVGGGLKWFSTRHVGIRGDYRFFMVKSKDNAPSFFGSENRYGHRVQAGLVLAY